MCRLNLVKDLDPALQIALASMLRIPVYMHNVPE